jgi:hypothetical protein
MVVSCGSSPTAATCGALGVVCCDGRACDSGTCIGDSPGVCADCGGAGQRCCDLGTCEGGGCCVNNICTPADYYCPSVGGACVDGSCGGGTCGAAGQACCAEPNGDTMCTAGEVVCLGGACAVCGGPGEPCCERDDCGPDLVCSNNACVRCGGPGEPCCAGNTCASGCCDQGPDVCITDGAACPSGGACMANACTCTGGELNCGNGCQDTTSNVDQCGACGTTCGDTQFCTNSACSCRPGLVPGPGNSCIDPDSNATACGTPPQMCGNATPVCSNGACAATCALGLDRCNNDCADTNTNPLHCGGCNNRCNNDEVCVQGNCEQFVAEPGCTTCPCAACGGDQCCTYPGATAPVICVNGGNGCPVAF